MSGSMSGMWKRGTVWIMRHRQTKGPDTDRSDLNNRVTSRLYSRLGLARPQQLSWPLLATRRLFAQVDCRCEMRSIAFLAPRAFSRTNRCGHPEAPNERFDLP